jgi:hypothetical protein
LFAGERLVGESGVQGVEKDDGDGTGVLTFELEAIGERVGGKRRGGVSAVKMEMDCGWPSSETAKSSLVRPVMGLP